MGGSDALAKGMSAMLRTLVAFDKALQIGWRDFVSYAASGTGGISTHGAGPYTIVTSQYPGRGRSPNQMERVRGRPAGHLRLFGHSLLTHAVRSSPPT